MASPSPRMASLPFRLVACLCITLPQTASLVLEGEAKQPTVDCFLNPSLPKSPRTTSLTPTLLSLRRVHPSRDVNLITRTTISVNKRPRRLNTLSTSRPVARITSLVDSSFRLSPLILSSLPLLHARMTTRQPHRSNNHVFGSRPRAKVLRYGLLVSTTRQHARRPEP